MAEVDAGGVAVETEVPDVETEVPETEIAGGLETELPEDERPPEDDLEKPDPLPDRQPVRPESAHIPKARLDAVLNRAKQTEAQVQELQAQLNALKPAAKDPIDTYLESVPKGEEGSDERRQYEDSELILRNPIVRGALKQQTHELRAVLAGVLQALDRVRFENDQILDTLVEKDDTGKIVKDRRPPGLKHLDRIAKVREETFKASGGQKLIRHADAFAQVQAQLEEEAEQATTQERTVRTDERRRTLQETQQRRSASGAGGGAPAVRVPRGTQTPGRLTPAEIDRSGRDYLLP